MNDHARQRWIAGVGVCCALLSACAAPQPMPGPAAPPAAAHAAQDLYVLLQPEATGLRTVDDDGRNTYFEFSIVVPAELRAFDGDGRRLDTASSSNLLGVPGVHDGVLLRLGTATTFVSIRPGAQRAAVGELPDSRELRQVRAALVTKGPVYQAMQRALNRVAEREGSEPDVGTALPARTAPDVRLPGSAIAPTAPAAPAAPAARPSAMSITPRPGEPRP